MELFKVTIPRFIYLELFLLMLILPWRGAPPETIIVHWRCAPPETIIVHVYLVYSVSVAIFALCAPCIMTCTYFNKTFLLG